MYKTDFCAFCYKSNDKINFLKKLTPPFGHFVVCLRRLPLTDCDKESSLLDGRPK